MIKQIMDKNVVMHVEELMKNGILLHKESNKEFYTGYEYSTLYDWDQYFESIVQIHMGWETTYIENGVIIFLDAQKDDGLIPRSIGGRKCNIAQKSEHCKPFLAQIVLLLYNNNSNLNWFDDNYYNKLKRFVKYWVINKDKNNNNLSTWDSAPHTGMDNQHERAGRWFDCYCEGVDLASFLYRECIAFSRIAEFKGHKDDKNEFKEYAYKIKEAVNSLMWNKEDGIYYDLDERTGKQIKVKYIGAFSTLWAGIADDEKAKILVERHLSNKEEFWRPFPVPVLAATEPGYSETKLENDVGCSWRAQTWIPTNYYIFHGLRKYGYNDIAKEIAMITYEKVKELGDREYYNTESCTGNGLNPFWGWSLLSWFMPTEYDNNIDLTKL